MASDANTRTLHSFLDYLRVERGSAKLTIAAYESDLAQFAEFLEKRKQNLTGERREDVRANRDWLLRSIDYPMAQ